MPESGALSLRDALALMLRHNPMLKSAAQEVAAREGGVIQAGLLPNPALGLEVENLGRSRGNSAMDGAESTLALAQLVQLGGKRSKRVKAARHARRTALWDYEALRIALLADTTRDFVSALAAQNRVILAREAADIAVRVHDTVSAKVEAGKVSPIALSRAEVVRARGRLDLDSAETELRNARTRLAGRWGEAEARFDQLTGSLAEITELPPLAAMESSLASHPAIERWEEESNRLRSEVSLARAQRVPDPTILGGTRYLDESAEGAFVVGVSIPLPVFNRNQGGIREAEARLKQATIEKGAALISLRNQLRVALTAAANSHRRAMSIQGEILPNARKAFESTQEAYEQGKIELIDVLDTRRTLFDVRLELLEAMRGFHSGRAEVEALVGRSLQQIPPAQDQQPTKTP